MWYWRKSPRRKGEERKSGEEGETQCRKEDRERKHNSLEVLKKTHRERSGKG